MNKKIICALLVLLTLTVSIFAKPKATLKRVSEDALLWEIDGKDKKGNDAKLYVFGTIHLGDDRLYPLPEIVTNAFNSADRLVSEVSTYDYQDVMFATLIRQGESGLRENKRVRESGKPLISYFNEEQIAFLTQVLGGNPQVLMTLCSYEPWVLSSNLNLIPMTMSGLDATKGVDQALLAQATMSGKFINGLDDLDTQLDLIQFGDWETQLEMLTDTINELMEKPEESIKMMNEMYEAYLKADTESLAKILNEDNEKRDGEYQDDFTEAMFTERNEDWAEDFMDYLKEGGTTFIFAGIGHFVGEGNVFEIMKENKDLAF